jgi:hypothetical protein
MGVKLCLSLSLSHILRKEHRLSVFENRILRRMFRPQREEVAGGWRRLHNEELHTLYASTIIIKVIKSRRMRWVGHVCRTHGRDEKCIIQNFGRKT